MMPTANDATTSVGQIIRQNMSCWRCTWTIRNGCNGSSVFLGSVNHAGPTDYTFLLCWRVFEDIRSHETVPWCWLSASTIFENPTSCMETKWSDTTWSCSLSTAFFSTVKWHDDIHCRTCVFQCSKWSFYRAANSIFAKVGSCLPILLYALDAK